MKETRGIMYKGYILLIVFVLVLTACSSGNGNNVKEEKQPNASTGDASKKEEKKDDVSLDVTVVTEYGGDETSAEVIKGMVDKYMDLNPHVKINLEVSQISTQDHRTWVTTQLLGGTAPDLFTTRYVWDQEDLGKGLLHDLTPHFQEENPYADNAVWEDMFDESLLEQLRGATNSYAGIPQYVNVVRIIYNQELFDKAGVEEPKTWNEFLEVQKKLKNAGIVPFAMPNSKMGDNALNWSSRFMIDQLVKGEFEKFDYDQNTNFQLNEYVKAIDEGLIDNTMAPYNQIWPMLKDWSQYWDESYNAMDYQTAIDMFLRGDSAMMLMALSGFKGINESSARTFDIGAFPFPILTKENDPNSVERVTELGTVPQMPLVIPSNIKEEKLEAAIDFLKFTTSPEIQKINAEELYQAPVIKNVELPSHLSGFNLVGDSYKFKLFAPAFDRNLAEVSISLSQLYMKDNITIDKFLEEMNKSMIEGANNFKEINDWNKENNYGIK